MSRHSEKKLSLFFLNSLIQALVLVEHAFVSDKVAVSKTVVMQDLSSLTRQSKPE